MEIDEFLTALKTACINGDPRIIIPYILSDKILTCMPNKTRFYKFFKYRLNDAKQNSIGNWTLKIEKTEFIDSDDSMAYKFYDERHKYARLCIIVSKCNDQIRLLTMPF